VIRLLFALLFLQAAVPTPPQPTSANQTPANASPAAPISADPAAVMFTSDVGMLLVTVSPAKRADYEAVIFALQEALAKAQDAEVRTMAAGWRIFKVAEADAKAGVLYVHVMLPAIRGVDYRPSLWLDKLLGGAPPELLAKYRDAFAGAPSKLSLVEFANMTVAPVTKPQ
jgi:hypothetical protein